eukprot:CAMPEP_0206138148 /NCGR_PEP_ID=MMETSP1473-20131121/3105_1 /ASSEMBLY_ACC=CAM_ASM_001109 /TAXON_ID=1461547 /ORGANISM="Stichococcus sp, Strain RCC1054" /LENGTH=1759 /DNA_ID=CAMNT_0053531493 /DNA_START=839 /DNA_END=6118 /DNA_ORIENTATION=+
MQSHGLRPGVGSKAIRSRRNVQIPVSPPGRRVAAKCTTGQVAGTGANDENGSVVRPLTKAHLAGRSEDALREELKLRALSTEGSMVTLVDRLFAAIPNSDAEYAAIANRALKLDEPTGEIVTDGPARPPELNPLAQEKNAGATVFISHRGTEKDRWALVWRQELKRSGVRTFVDERDLLAAEESDEAMQAQLRGATLVVFILTREFLTSKYCMEELHWALEQRDQSPSKTPRILPVFLPPPSKTPSRETPAGSFDIGDLGHLSEDSLKRLKSCAPKNMEADWIFRCSKNLHALSRFGAIRSDMYPGRGDDMVTNLIVKSVLRIMAPFMQLGGQKLIGCDVLLSEAKRFLGLLDEGPRSKSVLLGIHGMCGIGKTELAKAIYDAADEQFIQRRFFITVGDTFDPVQGRKRPIKLLIQNLLGSSIEPSALSNDKEQAQLLGLLSEGGAKLLVLDDVTAITQLSWLLGSGGTDDLSISQMLLKLPPGSAVVLTSRDSQVVDLRDVNREDSPYKCMKLDTLPDAFARALLCQVAFSQAQPPAAFTQAQMSQAQKLCDGLPLALCTLGLQLQQADLPTEWQDILDTFYQWRDRGQDKVSLVLRNSYQQLPRKAHRSMFLDAALMMLDRPVAHLIAVWQGELLLDPRFCARKASSSYLSWQNNRRKASAMRATQLFEYLKGVSLIKATDGMETPTPDDQTGGPSGRSVGPPRVQIQTSFVEFAGDTSTSHAECWWDDPPEVLLQQKVRSQRITGPALANGSLRRTPVSLTELLRRDSLRMLSLEATTVTMGTGRSVRADRLLYLRAMQVPEAAFLSKMTNLQVLDLSRSNRLKTLPPGISALGSLRQLDVSQCTSLQSLSNSISSLTSLQQLNVSGSWQLEGLPLGIGKLSNLQQLRLSSCKVIQELPGSIGDLSSLQELDLADCEGLEALPESLQRLTSLQQLNLARCKELKQLPENISALRKMLHLNSSGWTLLTQLPKSISALTDLQSLELNGCIELTQLPKSISALTDLRRLELNGCIKLTQLPDSICVLTGLQQLELNSCTAMTELPASFSDLAGLQQLDLSGCSGLKQLPNSVGALRSPQQLSIAGCSAIASLPNSIVNLTEMTQLDLTGCSSLNTLPGSIGNLTALRMLKLASCERLYALPDSIDKLKYLQQLDLSNCKRLYRFPTTINALTDLLQLDASGCLKLTVLPSELLALTKLQQLNVSRCTGLARLPRDIGTLDKLQQLETSGCRSLSLLPNSINRLTKLQVLILSDCASLSDLPTSISGLISLTQLTASGCLRWRKLPSLHALKNLRQLNLSGCTGLRQLPDSIIKLNLLEELDVSGCSSLQFLPEGISTLTQLTRLDLSGCVSVVELPEDITALNRLQLNTTGCTSLAKGRDNDARLQDIAATDMAAKLKGGRGTKRVGSPRKGKTFQLRNADSQNLRESSGLKGMRGPPSGAEDVLRPLSLNGELDNDLEQPGFDGGMKPRGFSLVSGWSRLVSFVNDLTKSSVAPASVARVSPTGVDSPQMKGKLAATIYIVDALGWQDSMANRLEKQLQLLFPSINVWRKQKKPDGSGPKFAGRGDLVVFVLTREFLCNSDCMKEVRHTLDKQSDGGGFPNVLTILQPNRPLELYTTEQLEAMPLRESEKIIDGLTSGGMFGAADLDPLRLDLARLIEKHQQEVNLEEKQNRAKEEQQQVQRGSTFMASFAASLNAATVVAKVKGYLPGQAPADRVELCKQDLARLTKLPCIEGEFNGWGSSLLVTQISDRIEEEAI